MINTIEETLTQSQATGIETQGVRVGQQPQPELPEMQDGRELWCGPICRNADTLDELCWNCYSDLQHDAE